MKERGEGTRGDQLDGDTLVNTDAIQKTRAMLEAHGLAGTPEKAATFHRLERAARLVNQRVEEALKPLGLTRTRYELLFRLLASPDGALHLGRISDLLLVHPTSVTSIVDRLEAAGFVERRVDPADRRAVLATLTDGGRGQVLAAMEALASIDFAMRPLTAAESETLGGLLLDLERADD